MIHSMKAAKKIMRGIGAINRFANIFHLGTFFSGKELGP